MSAPNDPGRGRKTPVHTAIDKKDLAQLEKVLTKWPDDIDISGGMHGETPLQHAVYKNGGWLEGVVFLLERGADINATKGMRRTPLMIAGEFGRVEIAERLVAAGADCKVTSLNGRDAAGWAKAYEHEELSEVLAKAKDQQLLLKGGDAAPAKALLE